MSQTATCDSIAYKMTFYGILNAGGLFWTPLAFESEAAARQHVDAFFANWPVKQTSGFKIVPVRIRLTEITPTPETPK